MKELQTNRNKIFRKDTIYNNIKVYQVLRNKSDKM